MRQVNSSVNFQTIEVDVTNPFYRYHSDEVNEETWHSDKVQLENLARREGLYFFTFVSRFPSANGTKMFAITDEYIPEPSLECELLFSPKG